MKTEKQMVVAAKAFAGRWKDRGYEKGDSQVFWTELLTEVFGVENPSTFIRFEEQVKVDKTNFIDGHILSTKVLIEQKSLGKDLRKGNVQSDGSVLNPFQQAKRYAAELPYSERPRWIVTCNFAEFLIYDMERPNGEPEQLLLKDLDKEYYRLQFLVDAKSEHLSKEMQVSMQAGEIVGMIYDALTAHPCLSPTPPKERTDVSGKKGIAQDDVQKRFFHDINVHCVRLVFCLYAEDAGIFGRHNMFHDYLVQFDAKHLRRALMDLFAVLNTPLKERDPYLEPDLAQFPYVNGGLFAEQNPLPWGGDEGGLEELRTLLLQNASLDFDWSEISPTIFGAVFESTLNPETRRSGGMHYTSIENIHKVIDPLFMNDLRQELDKILEEKVERQRQKKLDDFQERLASLTFLDPACGSGNFLTETYLSLRRLENEVIRERYHGQSFLGLEEVNPVKVSIQQFYGIEINDFAVTVATTALWISESQMLRETEMIIKRDIDFLPLKSYHNIKEGNALRLPWDEWEVEEKHENMTLQASEPVISYDKVDLYADEVITKTHPKQKGTRRVQFNYIIGNPPFVGARWMSKAQKDDVLNIFGSKWTGVGDLDYVSCWYMKAANLMRGTSCKAALVSTNSITQGGAVANLWKPLFAQGIHITFAWRTFSWDSEASMKAHVHCVIVGFSFVDEKQKTIFVNKQQQVSAGNINGYLLNAPNIFIEKRAKPLCDVPQIFLGGQPIDDGNLVLTEEEKEKLLKHEPQAAAFIRPYMMGKDFIIRKPRYCLWLKDAEPSLLCKCPLILDRVAKVKEFRLLSNRSSTLKAAEEPTLFGNPFECKTNYVALPKVSSKNRKYIPIDYLTPDIIPGDKLFCMQGASLYYFGVLTSNTHMAWMRAVCGRLKSDYSYSNTIVYNNFPWPTPTEAQKAKIEQTAQAILDARAQYPDSSLADLYDELAMPAELRKAHQQNDKAVLQAYGLNSKLYEEGNEPLLVGELFRLYQSHTK